MKLEELAIQVLDATEATGVPFMVVGAIAAGAYGVPRSTRDVDLLVSVDVADGIATVLGALEQFMIIDPQSQFDTLTWGKRHVAATRTKPSLKVEVFELLDDPFVREEFERKRKVFVPLLQRDAWLPSPEDVVVQKLRWGRGKDLDDARDVLAVQGPDKALNVTAAISLDGKTITFKAVNTGGDAVDVNVAIDGLRKIGSAALQVIAPGSENARNTLNEPEEIKPSAGRVTVKGKTVQFSMPGLSVGVVTVKLK